MRAVLFDVDGVLIHSMFHPDPAKRRIWSDKLQDDFGIDRDEFNKFFSYENFAHIVRGEESLISALDRYLPSIGAKTNSLEFISYWFENDTPLNYKLLDGIKQLQRSGKATVYLATNQEHLRAYHLWRELRLGHIFEEMFYAARIGSVKPEPEFFSYINEKLGPKHHRPLFFDDSKKNVDAGNAAGWESIHFETENDFFNHPWIKEQLK